MSAPIIVRPATDDDVAAMSAVLTASITELCAPDHHGDPKRLAGWLSNKTPDGVRGMMARPGVTLFVAERGGEVLAVGSLNQTGEIGLNYVSPTARFTGVSTALMAGLEAELIRRGHRQGHLTSTVTAQAFYRARGWLDGPAAGSDADGYPMHKALGG